MTAYRIMEICLYELLDLIPNLILALIPFRNHLRISRVMTGAVIGVLYVLLCISRVLALTSTSMAAFFTVAWVFLYLAFYLGVIKGKLTKLLFVLLIILNYSSFAMILSSYFTDHVWGLQEPYSFLSTLIAVLATAPVYPIVAIMLEKKVRPLIEFTENEKIWRLLWLVPATFCLAYYYNLYSNGGIALYSNKLNNVIFAVVFNAGAFFVTYLVIRLLEESNTNLRLKTENYQLSLRSLQYDNLKLKIEETRRAGHDLRQNLTIIRSYVRDRDYDGLEEYLKKYIRALPPDAPIVYCENYALNAVLAYYEGLAREQQVQFQASVESVPEDMEDSDIVVMFGNLLENALEACQRKPSGESFVRLTVRKAGEASVITMDNTHSGEPHKKERSALSSKGSREGIGLNSIRNIAEKYSGIMKTEWDEDVFHTSILMYP